jgi:predicted cupin superfamily sugar epimerase
VDARAVIERLELQPHPEGGWYRETWRGSDADGRPVGTSIYYLLEAGASSRWHRVDAAEVWSWHAGSPLELSISPDGVVVDRFLLGVALERGERPQVVVPAGAWQSARPLGEWALVGCAVAPGFSFEGFELAPPGWAPGADPRTRRA